MGLQPKNVLITGANRGLGLELVKQFLRLPSPPKTLLATCRSPENAKDLNDLASKHSNVKILKLDVTKPADSGESTTKLAGYLAKEGLNLLINNAGIAYKKQFLGNLEKQTLIEQFDVNIFGPILVSQALLPYIKQAAKSSTYTSLNCNRAAIVNMSSILGSIAENQSGGLYPYRTSKAALNMLTKNMNVDLKSEGILCFCMHPGWVQTDMGGPNAAVVKETSIAGILDVMSKMNGETSDIFIDYSGQSVPW
ncbi:C-factor-like isoform X1 [Mytilus californianus]|uniref:C-factor-like isoform X1 n=1 Tax=Mytilus californianus TaxID=6549 RepID=UPI002246DEB9|nr:C-factor-like isoform X1 [Mytilus californianus]